MNLHEVLEYLEGNFPVVYQSALSNLEDGAGVGEAVIDQWMIDDIPSAKTIMSLVRFTDDVWLWVGKTVWKDADEATFYHSPITKKVAHEIVNTCKKFHQRIQHKDMQGGQNVLMQSSVSFPTPRISFMRDADVHKVKKVIEQMNAALEKYFG